MSFFFQSSKKGGKSQSLKTSPLITRKPRIFFFLSHLQKTKISDTSQMRTLRGQQLNGRKEQPQIHNLKIFSSLSCFINALGWQLCGVMTRMQSAAEGSPGCKRCWHLWEEWHHWARQLRKQSQCLNLTDISHIWTLFPTGNNSARF